MSSLWWVQKAQLDADQIALIEKLPLRKDFLILGSAGSGKTNVLLRRAQFVRAQGIPNVQVLTFTRPLVEFVKTGCYDVNRNQIFPPSLVTTIESWLRKLHRKHGIDPPPNTGSDLLSWKRSLASSAAQFTPGARHPEYDVLFVDESQDLIDEEVAILRRWGKVLFCVGDNRQTIYDGGDGLQAIRRVIGLDGERALRFHYRVAPEICRVADRILIPTNGETLESTAHYKGPLPATVLMVDNLDRQQQIEQMVAKLREQIRVYGDLIRQGDRIGIVVARKSDRDVVLAALEEDPVLRGKAKIIRSKESGEQYDPALDSGAAVNILTVKGCKGLEFRAVHWPFANSLSRYHRSEHYYTVVTRAKTSLDVYCSRELPETLARAYSKSEVIKW